MPRYRTISDEQTAGLVAELEGYDYQVRHRIWEGKHYYQVELQPVDSEYPKTAGVGDTFEKAAEVALKGQRKPIPKTGINPFTGVPDLIHPEREPQEDPPEWVKKLAAAFQSREVQCAFHRLVNAGR